MPELAGLEVRHLRYFLAVADELTVAGVAFRRSAAVTLAHLERAIQQARAAARPAPVLRVNLPYESNGTGRDVLRRLRVDHGELVVERHTFGSGDVHAALIAGRVDLAIGGVQPTRRHRLRARGLRAARGGPAPRPPAGTPPGRLAA